MYKKIALFVLLLVSVGENVCATKGNIDTIPPAEIGGFGHNCLHLLSMPDVPSSELVEAIALEDQPSNTQGMKDPRLFILENKWIIKILKSRGLQEIEKAAELTKAISVDPSELHIYIPLLFATIRNEKWNPVKHVNEYAVGDIIEDDIVVEFMKKAEGEQLAHVWAELEPSDAISLFRQLGKGVRHLNNHGIFHGDLHWRNAIVRKGSPDWIVSFIDFDLWTNVSDYNVDCASTVDSLLYFYSVDQIKNDIPQYIAAFLNGYYAGPSSRRLIFASGCCWKTLNSTIEARLQHYMCKTVDTFDIKDFSARYCAAFKEIKPFIELDDRTNLNHFVEGKRQDFFPVLYNKDAPYPDREPKYTTRKPLDFLIVSICNLSDEEIILIHKWLQIEWLPCYCDLLSNPKIGSDYAAALMMKKPL